jgi:hypothetical protein
MKNSFTIALSFAAIFVISCSKDQLQTSNAVNQQPAANTHQTTAISTVTYTDESSFVASLSSYGYKNPSQLTLNRVGTTSGYNTVYGFNIPAANQVKGFKWNAGDEETTDWRPQGITGFTWGTKNYLLVTWYAVGPDDIAGVENKYKGVRIALVDITNMSNITYRLALLVQNKANATNAALYDTPTNTFTQRDSFIPVTMHAGGVAYYNQKIYIADTGLGLRVFDLNNFIAAEPDPGKVTIGKESNGDLKAFDYGYILPQSGYYKMTNAKPFSFVSLGEGTTPADKRLWTGQYQTSGTVAQLFGYPISASGVVTGPPTVIDPKDDTGLTVLNMQGAYRAGTKTFMTKTGNSSYEGSTARLVKYVDGAATGTRYRWPHGAEDLYLDSSGLLWNLTEYETSKYGKDNRCVFAVKLSTYQ